MSDNHFEKFTKESKQSLIVAQEVAKKMNTSYVGTEHILIGILSQVSSLGAQILNNFGVSLDNVNLVLKTVGRTQTVAGSKKASSNGLSGFAKKVIQEAVKCAHDNDHKYVGTEHILFALVSQENTAATVILENMKVRPNDIQGEINRAFQAGTNEAPDSDGAEQTHTQGMPPGAEGMNPLEFFFNGLQGVLAGNDKVATPPKKTDKKGNSKTKTPALDYFTTDMTNECREGRLEPVVGRAKEIERSISILQRKTKNNPVLIGEPGVGKTAVVEGLVHAIVKENVPDNMLDKRILSLSMASVVAGTKYRGEFEERVKQIIEEAASVKNVILFIDELHTVIGAGSAEGSLDAANILKPALSRASIQIVGATTTTEYRKHVEQDSALERRFQPVKVDEPTEEQTIEIMKGIRPSFEDHHNLVISDSALEAAVKLSKRYINDRYLPDKAIDLMDEASALKGMGIKSDNDELRKLQKKLNKIVKQKEVAVTSQDYEKAAELRSDELKLVREIDEQRKVRVPKEQRGEIDGEDIATVVSKATGVPVNALLKSDVDKLQNLEKTIKKHIVGQEDAIKAAATAIKRSRVGVSNPRRPIGSFIFLGPTGVGKTELVKVLAREVYNDEDALIKIDMSEFMERHNTSRLVGATAGYVGYEDGGQLTEAVRRKPYSVILFDEIEKAHPDVFNLLLQILEDGVLTDSKGRKVDFKNTIIVMTSNIGARKLTDAAGPIGFDLPKGDLEKAEEDFDHKKDQVLDELKESVRPEFLNRIDKIIVFKPLTHDDIKQIVKLLVDELESRFINREIRIKLDADALDVLATLSYDAAYGARPARRKIEELIEDPIAEGLLDGKFKNGSTIHVTKKGETVKVASASAPKAKKATKSKAKTKKK